MATDSPEKEVAFSPWVGDIFTAMFKQSEATTNAVMDNQDREIAEWKAKFLNLYETIYKANETVDSAKIDRILAHFDWAAERAAQGTHKN